MTKKSQGLIAAPFTPFNADRTLNLEAIEPYAQWLHEQGVIGAFICGTTGEGASLTIAERKSVAKRWVEVAPQELRVIVHVGHVCLADCCDLASHAQTIGADSIACLAPFFFRPTAEKGLVDWCRQVASAAPELPFYYYHIPSMTGFDVEVSRFLELAATGIPNLAGVKFTHNDFADLQGCVNCGSGRYDILFGRDELLLSALRLGVGGAVGSTYNFAAPLYHSMIEAFLSGDQAKAERLQKLAAQMIDWLAGYGGSSLSGFKRFMSHVAIDCGPTRQPLTDPTDQEFAAVCKLIESSALVEWLPASARK